MNNNLACLLLPSIEKNILLPSAAVAEIVAYDKPQELPDMPWWLHGILTWRGIQIPLTNLDWMEFHTVWQGSEMKVEKEDAAVLLENYRIAVLNRSYKIQEVGSQDKKSKYPFFGILLKKNPKLYRLTNSDVHLVKEFDRETRYKMEVKIFTELALIPNLDYLWKIIDGLPSRLQWFRQIIM